MHGQALEDLLQLQKIITALAAGDYNLTVTDANGCVLPVTITVGQTANTLAQTNAVTLAGCG